MAFQLTFSNEYEFKEGGGGDFSKEGFFPFTIAEVTEGQSGSQNMTLKCVLLCQHPELSGRKVWKSIPVTGKNRQGKDNVLQLMDLLVSIYTAEGKSIKEAEAECGKLFGQQLSSDSVIETLTGKVCYAETVARPYTGNDGKEYIGGEIKNFVSKDKVVRLAQANADTRPLPPALQAIVDARIAGGDPATTTTGGSQPDVTSDSVV